MGKIAFVFAGQGAQAPGMGKALYDSFEAAREVFDRVDGIRPGTSAQCFSGTEEELKNTANTQPCMFAVELAAAAVLDSLGIKADMTAGFSLGELSALTYAGAMDLETGTRLVMKRGALMQEAAGMHDTSMAAVVKLSNEEVERICAQFDQVYPVNFNCPGQVACSGAASEMGAFGEAVKAAGGKALPVKVSGAFHSPFMDEAAAQFAELISTVDFKEPQIPVYSNCTASVYGSDVAEVLKQQINNPVRWETIIRKMIEEGVDTFIEVGPGKTLSGFIKRTDPSVRSFTCATEENVNAIIAEVKGC
ncbi:MAG: ACP S-malonyltransferase [Lachnospiraceae bacterium]|nr:ACP S-malonyltransferase [Lachnospiraceae bacterium]